MKLLLLFLLVPTISCALQGGIKVRVTKKGLEYVGKKLIERISTKIRSTPIPDQSGKKGKISYSVKNVKLNRFTSPQLSYQGKTGHGFIMTMNGAGINGVGDWRYKFKTGFIRISDHGSIKINVRGINIQVHATMGLGTNQKPTIRADAVRCTISKISIRVRSKIGWFYNFIIKIYSKKIRKMVEKAVKKAITDAINNSVNESLSTLNLQTKVLGRLNLNYGLTSPPYFDADYIEASMTGTFTPNDNNAVPNMVFSSDRMVMMAISEKTFNNFANAAFNQNLLKFVYSDKKSIQSLLPPKDQFTNPSLSYKVTVTAKNAPLIAITKNQISCSLTAKVLLDMFSGKTSRTFLDVEITTNPTFTISIQKDLVKFEVISIPFSVSVVDNSVLDGAKLETALKQIMDWLLPQINKEAKKGFKLPSLKKVAFKNGLIRIHQGYVNVATDFSIV